MRTLFITYGSDICSSDPVAAFDGAPHSSVHAPCQLSCPVSSAFALERSTARYPCTLTAVTYTAMITRIINSELNYRIPASHSNQVPNSTIRRHVFPLSLCRQVPFLSLTSNPIISQMPNITANLLQSKTQSSFVPSGVILPSRLHVRYIGNHTLHLHRWHVHVYKILV